MKRTQKLKHLSPRMTMLTQPPNQAQGQAPLPPALLLQGRRLHVRSGE